MRALAKHNAQPSAETPESRDACLVEPGQSFSEMLRKRFDAPARVGHIVDEAGEHVGEHDGFHLFTIGQRKGLPAGATARRWVKSISADTGDVVVTTNPDELVCARFSAKNLNWLDGDLPAEPRRCSVQVRYRHPSEPAIVVARPDGRLQVTLENPVKAVTPGQAAGFYDGDRTLGRGWIDVG